MSNERKEFTNLGIEQGVKDSLDELVNSFKPFRLTYSDAVRLALQALNDRLMDDRDFLSKSYPMVKNTAKSEKMQESA